MATGVAQKDSQLRLMGWAKRHPGKLASLQLIRMDQKICPLGLSFCSFGSLGSFAFGGSAAPWLFLLAFPIYLGLFLKSSAGLEVLSPFRVSCLLIRQCCRMRFCSFCWLLFADWHCCQSVFLRVAWFVLFCLVYPVQVSAGSSKRM